MRELIGATRRYPIDQPFTLPYAGEPVSRVVGDVLLTRTDRGLLAQAELTATAPETCSRCLQPLETPLVLSIEEEYLPTVDPMTGARLPEPAEQAFFLIDAAHHIDLEEAARQAAVLAETMAPLCRPDCQGLCAQCGANLNDRRCACETGTVDERWAALRAALPAE